MTRRLFFFLLIVPHFGLTQSFAKLEATRIVFNNLIQAYANSKSAPQLKFIHLNSGKSIIARYIIEKGSHYIEIDEKLINVCFSIGSDSLNALAIILSHELAHYYYNHEWCSDYAYAISSKNLDLAKKINKASISAKTEKETIADNHGLFYASVAGYSVFDCYDNIINKVYKSYNLPEQQFGYPSLRERKKIAKDASMKARELFGFFTGGLQAINVNEFDKAIELFNKANAFIPFRENYNNIGVAKTRKALLLKPKTYEEVQYPERFLYPLEVENKSRLSQDEETRGMDDDKDLEITKLLNEAKKDFQEAIRIDPLFTKGHINLACVYDLLDNPAFAIGIIKSLTPEEQNSIEAKRILAIAYYHNNQKELAEEIWNK